MSTQEVLPRGCDGGRTMGTPIPNQGVLPGCDWGGSLPLHSLGVSPRALLWAEVPSGVPPPPEPPCTCGFFLGRPRPLFSATSFSPLAARGWLDLAPDSLIVLQLW